MNLQFTKMHGLGNDFIVLDGVSQVIDLNPEQIRTLGSRHTGIGFDQMLVVAPATQAGFDFSYLVFNPDGSQAENCGNGARCLVSFIRSRGLSDKDEFALQLVNGSLHCKAAVDGRVTVNMGAPVFSPSEIPFIAGSEAQTYSLALANGVTLEVSVLSMGNPHAVAIVESVGTTPVPELGPLLESHELFPNRVNAGFMEIVNTGTIRLRVFERGAGETLACGTGACAAVVAGISQGLLDDTVTVQLPCGELQIHWQGGQSPVFKTGPAVTVFEGTITV